MLGGTRQFGSMPSTSGPIAGDSDASQVGMSQTLALTGPSHTSESTALTLTAAWAPGAGLWSVPRLVEENVRPC